MTTTNHVTEQLTAAGRAIEHDSFAIIDAEAGPHAYTAEQWPLVRRMIHANADDGAVELAETVCLAHGLHGARRFFGLGLLDDIRVGDEVMGRHAEVREPRPG